MSVTDLRRQKTTTLQRPVGDKPSAANNTLTWQRPNLWLPLPDVTGQQKFAGLHLISKDGNFVALSAAGDYTVDWGDGTSTNHSSGTVAYKQYNYADIADTGESELGYRQVIIQVTPQAGQNLTALYLDTYHNQSGLSTFAGHSWLDIRINSANLNQLSIGSSTRVMSVLQQVNLQQHSLTNMSGLFQQCSGLRSVKITNTASVTNMSNMFRDCTALQSIPSLNTSSVTNMSGMFRNCNALQSVPLFDTKVVTDMSYMFFGCLSLESVPLFDTSAVTNMSIMFAGCRSLRSVPLFNTALVTDMSSMFSASYALESVPLFNTTSVTNMSGMFASCYSLQFVSLFNTASVTDMSTMFTTCESLQSIPLFNTVSVSNMSRMFNGCRALRSVPLLNTALVTNMSSMFLSCASLQSIPLLDTSSVTDMSNMFNACWSLKEVPQFNTSSATSMQGFLQNCHSLYTIPIFNVSSLTDSSNLITSSRSLVYIPAINAQQAPLTCSSNSNLSWVDMTNMNKSVNFSGGKLSANAISHIISNLQAVVTTQTINLSNNYGLGTAISKSNCVLTGGSRTVTQSNTSDLSVGMTATGTGVSSNFPSVTFSSSTNTATLNNHGLLNGTPITFISGPVLGSPVSIGVEYFVVNATANTFQIASTVNGTPISFTTNLSGTIRWPMYITGITSNVSITLSGPATISGSYALSFRNFDPWLAVSKGWTVTS